MSVLNNAQTARLINIIGQWGRGSKVPLSTIAEQLAALFSEAPIDTTNDDLATRMATQSAEFNAAQELAKQIRRHDMTAVVDDDYPSVRHSYESAVRAFLKACKANGRLM